MRKHSRIIKYLLCFLILLFIAPIIFLYIPISNSFLANRISQQTDYYFKNEDSWIKDHNVLEVAYYKLWEFKARRELAGSMRSRAKEYDQLSSQIKYIVNETKNAFLTQHQQEIPVISGSALSGLVRGFGYCDQINGGLVLLLQDELDYAHLYNIYTDSNRHTVIKSHSELGTVWVDAYGCYNMFGFSDELTTKGKLEVNTYPSSEVKYIFPEKSYREGVFFNAFTFEYSCKKGVERCKRLFDSPKDSSNVNRLNKVAGSVELNTKPSKQFEIFDSIQADNFEAKSAYLKARVYHLSGEYEKAIVYYKIVKEKTTTGYLGRYAETFIRRLEGKEVLCSSDLE